MLRVCDELIVASRTAEIIALPVKLRLVLRGIGHRHAADWINVLFITRRRTAM